MLGEYTLGSAQTERLVVSRNNKGALVMGMDGEANQKLFHHGGRVFNPSGAEAVRIRFQPASGRAASLTISDGALTVRATR